MDEVDIKCTYSIEVGVKGGPCPVVYDIAWNPRPTLCSGDTIAMLACVSSIGVSIYTLKKNKQKFASVDIHHRPSLESKVLAWNRNGLVLAAASSDKGGRLSIISDDGKGSFTAKTALLCPAGEAITSMCWVNMGSCLVLALFPCSALCFLRAKDGDPENLEYLGLVKYADHFDGKTPIVLATNTYRDLLAYSHKKLLHFQHSASHPLEFKLHNALEMPMGIRRIVYDYSDPGLLTMENDRWRYWHIRSWMDEVQMARQMDLTEAASTPDQEKRRRKHADYRAIALSPSGRYFCTGGYDNLSFYEKEAIGDDTVEVTYKGSRTNVNWGNVNCMAFNPTEDRSKLIALGGDTGYLFVWAVVERGTLKNKSELVRQKEYDKKFYGRTFTQDDKSSDKYHVSDPNHPIIELKLEDIVSAEDMGSLDGSGGTQSQSDGRTQSQSAGRTQSQSAAAATTHAVADDAVDSTTAALGAVASARGPGPDVIDTSTFAHKLASVNQKTEQQVLRQYEELRGIANQAVSTIMSMAERAEEMLKRRNEITDAEITGFLEMVSAAQRPK